MNIKALLKTSIFRDQSIILTGNVTEEETKQVATYLQMKLIKNEVPNWRPIGFTMAHREGTFISKVHKSNAMLGSSVQQIADRITHKVSLGDIYMPPKEVWGYTNVNDLSKPINKFSDQFGFGGDKTNGTGQILETRRRNILTCPTEDCRFAFCRNMPHDDTQEYYAGNYAVPVPDNSQAEPLGVGIRSIDNIYGDVLLHRCDFNRVVSSATFMLKDLRPVFLIFMKRGTGFYTKEQNALNIVPELRQYFCFCNTNYSLADVIKIRGASRNTIFVELYTRTSDEKQLQYIFNNM